MTTAGKVAAAAAAIATNPRLSGYARTGGRYTGRFSYGTRTARPEMKYFDVTLNNYSVGDKSGKVQTLLTIPQGVGQSERIGRKITVRGVLRLALGVIPRDLIFFHKGEKNQRSRRCRV